MQAETLSLSLIESHRVVALLEETIEKLHFLESITPDVLQHRDELSKFVGDEISRIIQEQRVLENRYEELIAQRGALKGLSNKSKYKQVQAEIKDVSRALRESTKNLCRNLKENPNIQGNLVKIQKERASLADLLARAVRELRDARRLGALAHLVEDDRQQQARLKDLVRRERETAAAVRQLEADLAAERAEHRQHTRGQRAALGELREQLRRLRDATAVDAAYRRREAGGRTGAALRVHRQGETQLRRRIQTLRKKKEVEETVHQRTKEFLVKKQNQLLNDLDAWQKKHEEDLGELDEKYDKLQERQSANFQQLSKLLRRKEAEDQAAAQLAEEAQRRAEQEARLREEAARQDGAARRVQRLLRAYAAKKKEEDAKKAAEKKSKKGGKGKKKK